MVQVFHSSLNNGDIPALLTLKSQFSGWVKITFQSTFGKKMANLKRLYSHRPTAPSLPPSILLSSKMMSLSWPEQ
jgi:hypothetical protein